jgi:hypothetical protein
MTRRPIPSRDQVGPARCRVVERKLFWRLWIIVIARPKPYPSRVRIEWRAR